jgi:hypothetical protein
MAGRFHLPVSASDFGAKIRIVRLNQNVPRFHSLRRSTHEGMPQRIGFCAQIYSVFDVRSRFHALSGQA